MPDELKGIGKNISALIHGEALNAPIKTLRRFNEGGDQSKSVSDRTTLDATKREAAIREQQEKAATDFEALLLQQMVQSMWKSVPSEGMLSGSNEEAMYRDMLSEQFAQDLAKGQSLGLKEAVLGEMTKKQKL